MRGNPLSAFGTPAGLGSSWTIALVACVAFLLISQVRRPALALTVLVGSLSAISLYSPGQVVLWRPTALTVERPVLDLELPSAIPATALALDSAITNSLGLPNASLVAEIRVRRVSGSWDTHAVRTGSDTGDWAGRREDVRDRPGFEIPPPWLTWFTSSGELAQRYRHVRSLDPVGEIDRVQIRRNPSLPPKTAVLVYHLELRR
jgi:hypothetical protein